MHLGSLGPGYQADVLCFDELGTWRPARVWQGAGSWSRTASSSPARCRPRRIPELMRGTMNIGTLPEPEQLVLEASGGDARARVGVVSRSLTTVTSC